MLNADESDDGPDSFLARPCIEDFSKEEKEELRAYWSVRILLAFAALVVAPFVKLHELITPGYVQSIKRNADARLLQLLQAHREGKKGREP